MTTIKPIKINKPKVINLTFDDSSTAISFLLISSLCEILFTILSVKDLAFSLYLSSTDYLLSFSIEIDLVDTWEFSTLLFMNIF
jgi:hypothetical protein